MAFDGSDLCWRPSIQIQTDVEPRLTTSAYGDGYAQRAIDGINPNKVTWSCAFNGRHKSIINAMDQYLRDLKGAAFPFKDPLTGNIVSVFCDKWSIAVVVRKPTGDWIGNLTAAFYTANGTGLSV